MLGPATNTRVELGINAKDLGEHSWLLPQTPGGMCQYKVMLTSTNGVPIGLADILKVAYEAAG